MKKSERKTDGGEENEVISKKKKIPLAYAPPSSARNNSGRRNSQKEGKKVKKKNPLSYAPPSFSGGANDTANDKEEQNDAVLGTVEKAGLKDPPIGAFAIRPGGYARPVNQASLSSLDLPEDQQMPRDESEKMLTVPHATLVEEEDFDTRFDTRLRKMFQGATAVEVVLDNNNENNSIISGNKKKRKMISVIICFVLLVIIIISSVKLVSIPSSTSQPSSQPSLSATSSPEVITSSEVMTLFLRYGNNSNTIKLELSCENYPKIRFILNAKPFKTATDVIEELPVDIMKGMNCTVKLTNEGGTGLMPNGTLRFHQGASISMESALVELSGNFTDETFEFFQVESIASETPSLVPTSIPSTSNTPSIFPTPEPIMSPSESDIPSIFPTPEPTPWPTVTSVPTPFTYPPVAKPPPPAELPSQRPTYRPVPTAAPSFPSYSIVVEINLDQYPIETGWYLVCDDISLASFPPESYLKPSRNINLSYDDITYNSECLFVIEDTAADGNKGYNITVLGGDAKTVIQEFSNNGQFGSQKQELFQVGVL